MGLGRYKCQGGVLDGRDELGGGTGGKGVHAHEGQESYTGKQED